MNTLSRSTILLGLFLLLGVSLSLAQPSISGLSAQSGAAGSTVIISGANFSATSSNDIVRFGGVKANVTAAATGSLTVTVPSNASTGIVTVTVTSTQMTAYWSKPFKVTFPFAGPIDTNSFAAPVSFTAGSSASITLAGDFDGDGKIDIGVVNNGDNSISLFLNTSTPGTINSSSFAPQVVLTTGVHPWGTAVADIDGDGKLDIIVCNGTDSTVSVFRNTSTAGNLSFASRVNFHTGFGAHDVVAVDFDHDGQPDLVVTNYNGALAGQGTISVLKNVSVGSTIAFNKHFDIPVDDGPRALAVGDIDGDNWPDIAVGCYDGASIKVFQNQSYAHADTVIFIEQSTLGGFSPDAVEIADIDGDGVGDVMGASVGDGVWLFRGATNFSFEGSVLYHKGPGQGNLFGADINGDGKIDILSGNALETSVRVGTVTVLLNATTGTGTFTTASLKDSVNYYLPSIAYTAAVADVDGDGRPDIIAAGYYSRTLGVLRSRIFDTYTVNPSTGGPGTGTISPSGAFSIRHGHDTTFTITATGGSHIDSVVVDGVNKYVNPTYTLTNVTSNHTIKAYFSTGVVFAITSSAGANGTISPNGTVNVPTGGNQSYTITPNPGFGIATVLVDGSPVANTAKYTFSNVLAVHTIAATFAVGVNIPLKVYLQGPAVTPGDTMTPLLKTSGTLAGHFTGVPIPSKAVDSINVELRSAQTTAGSTTRKFQPAWLLSDGTITSFGDTTKNYVRFDTTNGSYYIVVRHRNHLAVMSAAAIPMTSTSTLYDFTTGQAQAFGTVPMIQVGAKFCMYAGDGNGDGQITTLDFSPWLVNAKAAITGYSTTDYNCDGQNTTSDFTQWLVNAKSAATSQVP